MKIKRAPEERKIAQRKASRRWAEAHPEKAKEAARRWAADHPEKHKEANRRWRAAHPEKVKEGNRRWRAAHPEEYANQKVRQHYGEEAPEHYRKQHEKQKGKCGICEE